MINILETYILYEDTESSIVNTTASNPHEKNGIIIEPTISWVTK